MLWVDSIGISNVYPAEPPVENIEKIWKAINGRHQYQSLTNQ